MRAVIGEQLVPLFRELRTAQNAAVTAEGEQHALAGTPPRAEPEWQRAGKAQVPDAMWRIATIQAIAETGRPLPFDAQGSVGRPSAGEGARRLTLS